MGTFIPLPLVWMTAIQLTTGVESTAAMATMFEELAGPVTEPLLFELEDPLPDTIPPGSVTTFTIRIVSGSEAVIEASAKLWYRKGSGGFVMSPLAYLGDDRYAVPLPAAPCGALIDYYLSAAGDGGSIVYHPPGAPAETHTVQATAEEIIFADDFEVDAGWTNVCEVATDPNGAGCWTRVVPIGTTTGPGSIPAQPGQDHTTGPGGKCFVTGQPFRAGDDEWLTDVDGGPVELLSPAITLNLPDANVQYARWFFSRSDNNPALNDELLVEMSRDAGATWHEIETVSSTGSWVVHGFSLSEFPLATGNQLQIRFSTCDCPNNSVTEAAIDDVEVRSGSCASGKGDYDGNGAVDLADFPHLAGCLTGPEAGPIDDWCATFDFDNDGDVDLNDWRDVQLRFGPAHDSAIKE